MPSSSDPMPFIAFYRDYYSLALTVAQQRLRGAADAEDITAEAFRLTWTHHRAGNVLTLRWLYRVLRNLIGNEYRRLERGDRFAQVVEPLLQDVDAEFSTDDALEIRRCILRLPEESRELLYMAYWEGLSRGEMAEILGHTPENVRIRLMRARNRLEALLTAPEATARDTPGSEVDRHDERI